MPHRVTLKPSGHSFEVRGRQDRPAGRPRCRLRASLQLPRRRVPHLPRHDHGRHGRLRACAPRAICRKSDKAKGFALLCQAKPLADLVVEVREVAGLRGIRPQVLPARVERLDKPAPDVAILGLQLPTNDNFQFLAGQYVDFLLKEGKRRSYSIANPPSEAGGWRARVPRPADARRPLYRAGVQHA